MEKPKAELSPARILKEGTMIPKIVRVNEFDYAYLRTARKMNGWTLKQLASKAGISITFLSEIERGIVSPSIKTLLKLANCLRIRASLLFTVDYVAEDSDHE